jgi:hypothetical protein
MEEIVEQIIAKWKIIIESTVVNGYSRKVDSIDCFRMNAWYSGYPEIEFCYKVTFNFPMVGILLDEKLTNLVEDKSDNRLEKWHKRLEDRFTNMFWSPSDEVFGMPRAGSNSGETKFENNKVDYMTNQGYRFIIQFYPKGFIPELREEKLNNLLV